MKISVDVRDKKYDTPLHSAAYQGRTEIAEFLLKRCADANATNLWGFPPTFVAALCGKFDILKFFLQQEQVRIKMSEIDPEKKYIAGKLDVSLLHIISAYDEIDLAETLVDEKGLNVNIGTEGSVTPLHVAAFFNSTKLIKYLLNKNADKNASANFLPVYLTILPEIQTILKIPWAKNVFSVFTGFSDYSEGGKSFLKTPIDICKALGYRNILNKSEKSSEHVFKPPPKELEFLKLFVDQRNRSSLEKSDEYMEAIYGFSDYEESYFYRWR